MNIKKSPIASITLLVIIIVCLNIVSAKIYGRLDVTDDSLFTISDGTKSLLKKVDRPISIKFYFSKSMEEVPVPIKSFANRVEELLNEYALYSSHNIEVESIDPEPDTEAEEWAKKYGLSGVQLSRGDNLYLGAVFISGKKELSIPFLDPQKEGFLEYEISEIISRLLQSAKPKVAIYSSLPIFGNSPQNPMEQQQGSEEWALLSQLQKSFEIEKLDSDFASIPEEIKLAIIIHPKGLSETSVYAIDQHLVNGGRLIVALDPFSRIDLLIQSGGNPSVPGQNQPNSSLDKLTASWGIDYSSTDMVGDLLNATPISLGGGYRLNYPFFLSLNESSLSKDSTITGNLKQILLAEPGAFTFKESEALKWEPIISSSKDSATMSTMMAQYLQPDELAKRLKPDGKKRALAGILSGKFQSAYGEEKPASGDPKIQHKKIATEDTSVMLVADVDFMTDSSAVDKIRFGRQVIVRPKNDNLSLILNSAELFSGSSDLIAIRSRGEVSRPFTKLQEIQKDASLRWQKVEEELTTRITELQQKLGELQKQRTDGGRYFLTDEQQTELKRFQTEEGNLRKKRREVRKNLREDIESLEKRLIALNMLVVPCIVGLSGFYAFQRRTRRARKGKTS